MEPLAAILTFLTHRVRLILPLAVVSGIALPALADTLLPFLPAMIFTMLAVSLMRVDWSALMAAIRRPVLSVLSIGWLLIASPLLAVAALTVLPVPDVLRVPIALGAAMPCIMSGAALIGLMGLEAALALVVVIGSTLLLPFTLSSLAALIPGLSVDVPVLTLFLRSLAFVSGALAVGLVGRWLMGPARLQHHASTLDGMIVLIMIGFALAVMAPVANGIRSDSQTVGIFTIVAFAFSILFQIATLPIFVVAGLKNAVTTGFLAGHRNTGLLIAVLPAPFDPNLLLYVAVTQLPIYMMPSMLHPVVRWIIAAPPSRPADTA